jgi:hypothetical protein
MYGRKDRHFITILWHKYKRKITINEIYYCINNYDCTLVSSFIYILHWVTAQEVTHSQSVINKY